jgi:hypothetical protein
LIAVEPLDPSGKLHLHLPCFAIGGNVPIENGSFFCWFAPDGQQLTSDTHIAIENRALTDSDYYIVIIGAGT